MQLEELSAEIAEYARCRGTQGVLHFSTYAEDIAAAKAICRLCLVRTKCLALAVWQNEREGVWGGLDEHERRKYYKTLERRTNTVNALLKTQLATVPAENELRPPHLRQPA